MIKKKAVKMSDLIVNLFVRSSYHVTSDINVRKKQTNKTNKFLPIIYLKRKKRKLIDI